jgi:hypothetical protein
VPIPEAVPEVNPDMDALAAAMAAAEVNDGQLLAFYNQQKGTALVSLAEIPKESVPKLTKLLGRKDSEQVKAMKVVPAEAL